MTTLSKISFVSAFAALLMVTGPPATAQTTTPSTTLCAAITSTSAQTICLTSITNIVSQTSLYIEGEFMQAVGTPTVATAVRVQRATSSGSGPSTHASGAVVWEGLTPGYSIVPGINGFTMKAGLASPQGTCTYASQVYLPIIYVNLGKLFTCDANTGVWREYLVSGPVVGVTAVGAANAITSPVGSRPAYTGIIVQAYLNGYGLQAGANTFAYAGGTALAIKSSRNPANNIGTAYVTTGTVTLELALIGTTLTWLDTNQ